MTGDKGQLFLSPFYMTCFPYQFNYNIYHINEKLMKSEEGISFLITELRFNHSFNLKRTLINYLNSG